jgi:drug/metabolite transporter (DMT)-like permease
MSPLVLMSAMVIAAACGGLGQVMMQRASAVPLLQAWPFFIAFAGLYGVGVIINYGVYRLGGRVSVMYPIISLSYVAATFFAWKLLGEPVSGWSVAGICCIIVGVSLVGWGAVA